MHELAIAENILEIIRQHVPEDDLHRIRFINLQIGEEAGIVVDSLEFSFSAITSGTQLENASMKVGHIPFSIECRSCKKIFSENLLGMICPDCGGNSTRIVSGTEMRVTSIELDDLLEEA